MSESARAAVFYGPGQPLKLREFPLPKLKSGEGLVRITYSTICGSDLHTILGKRSTPTPTVLGHEIIGTIAELPPERQLSELHGCPLNIGDRVTWSIAASCGQCFFCGWAALPQKCDNLFKYGHQQIDDRCQLSGGMAEFCHLMPGTVIVRLPDDLPDEVACPANCATATVAAAVRTAGGCQGKNVVIFGAGMLGLTAAAMAAFQQADSVVAIDVIEERVQRALQFGANEAIVWQDDAEPIRTTVNQLTQGRGADVVLEMSGSPTAMELAPSLLRIGGRLMLVGSVFPGANITVNPEQLVRRLIRIEGVHNYVPGDLAEAVTFLNQAQSIYPFTELVKREFDLDEANDAVEFALNNAVARAAIKPPLLK